MHDDPKTEFIESLGLILQSEGFSRIAGRLLGVFVLEGGPFSFGELCEKLQVSRGSISTNTRLLENLGAIERVGVPGERQDYFRLAEEPYRQLIERKVQRARRAGESIHRASHATACGDLEATRRIQELAAFFLVVGDACETALTRLGSGDADNTNIEAAE